MFVYIYIYKTNRYILSLLNTDDINYANKTLSLCMYVCMYVCMYADSSISSI